MKHIPGIDMSSGSLGQGLSAAAGMAAAGKFDKKITVSMHSAETVRSRKARSGKLPCGQDSANWTIWL